MRIRVPNSALSGLFCLTPVNLEESWSLKILFKKILLRNYSSKLTLTRYSYFCFSLYKRRNNKITLQLLFWQKSKKIKTLKKKSPLSSLLTNFGKCWSFRGTRKRQHWYISKAKPNQDNLSNSRNTTNSNSI